MLPLLSPQSVFVHACGLKPPPDILPEWKKHKSDPRPNTNNTMCTNKRTHTLGPAGRDSVTSTSSTETWGSGITAPSVQQSRTRAIAPKKTSLVAQRHPHCCLSDSRGFGICDPRETMWILVSRVQEDAGTKNSKRTKTRRCPRPLAACTTWSLVRSLGHYFVARGLVFSVTRKL